MIRNYFICFLVLALASWSGQSAANDHMMHGDGMGDSMMHNDDDDMGMHGDDGHGDGMDMDDDDMHHHHDDDHREVSFASRNHAGHD